MAEGGSRAAAAAGDAARGLNAAAAAAGGGYANLQEDTPSEDELKSAEWEARLASGDLPDDFLQVTEPRPDSDASAGATRKMASNSGFEPEVANLVDVPTSSAGAVAAAANTSPSRRAMLNSATEEGGGGGGAAIGGAPATNPSGAGRRSLGEAESPYQGDKPQSLKGDAKRFVSTEEQDRAMALALQEQLNMEDGEAPMAYQAGPYGQVVAAPANMIGRLTGECECMYVLASCTGVFGTLPIFHARAS